MLFNTEKNLIKIWKLYYVVFTWPQVEYGRNITDVALWHWWFIPRIILVCRNSVMARHVSLLLHKDWPSYRRTVNRRGHVESLVDVASLCLEHYQLSTRPCTWGLRFAKKHAWGVYLCVRVLFPDRAPVMPSYDWSWVHRYRNGRSANFELKKDAAHVDVCNGLTHDTLPGCPLWRITDCQSKPVYHKRYADKVITVSHPSLQTPSTYKMIWL